MKFNKILPAMLALGCASASASDLDSINALAQSQFRSLAENLGAATVYKAVSPAEPLGVLGFDASLSVSATEIDEQVFEIANGAADWDMSMLPLPRLQLQKGLPFNIDIGASYTAVPEISANLIGAEVKWAFIGGGIATPAVAARLSYSKLSGIDELDVKNTAVDVSISKGFAVLTPYAGVGLVRSESTPRNVAGLTAETVNDTRLFAGLNINFGINLGLEVDTFAGLTSYTAKVGVRF